jgi:hypothetical protein
MGQRMLRIEGLPQDSLDAAAAFHSEWLGKVRRALVEAGPVVLVFPATSYDHRGWRLAVVQDLAREAAPKRVNAIAGDDESAIAGTAEWLAQAPGVTGQLLAIE